MEHIAGVRKGGTFIIVYDVDDLIIADFHLPYHCCDYIADDLIVLRDLSDEQRKRRIEEYVGRAEQDEADDLAKINQIGKERAKTLNFYGIYTFRQLSRMTEDLFDMIDIHSARSKHWPGEAEKLQLEKEVENKKERKA